MRASGRRRPHFDINQIAKDLRSATMPSLDT
jgi:hypothetical protein